ncbi:uncharacterized protein V1510DRAFT_375321 [Dipodascopsis tothii]|uniref:uncharacterized protein n=1 Tax=Dipodascopsis tothii TaxID=44089 RepID=UPI0034CD0FEC
MNRGQDERRETHRRSPSGQDGGARPSALTNVFRSWTKTIRNTYNGPAAGAAEQDAAAASLHIEAKLDRQVLVKRLETGGPAARIEAARALAHALRTYDVADAIDCWFAAQDMLAPANAAETRHAALRLLAACIEHDMSAEHGSAVNKLEYYKVLAEHDVREDFDLQLAAFKILTNDGRQLPVLGPAESPFVPILTRWLKQQFAEATAARQDYKAVGGVLDSGKGNAGKAKADARYDARREAYVRSEGSLRSLLAYIVNLIKFDFYAFDEQDVIGFLGEVLEICRRTSSRDDITDSIALIKALTAYGYLPLKMLDATMETLCGASVVVPELDRPIWDAIVNIVKSHLGNNAVATLYMIMREARSRKYANTNTVKGAAAFLVRLLQHADFTEKHSQLNLTINSVMISFKLAMEAAARSHNSGLQVDYTVLKAIESILANPVSWQSISFDDWRSDTSPLNVIVLASRRATIPAARGSARNLADAAAAADPHDEVTNKMVGTLHSIIARLEASYQSREYIGPPNTLMTTFLSLHAHIGETMSNMVIDYYDRHYLCYPSTSDWTHNVEILLDAFYSDPDVPLSVRERVLNLVQAVYSMVKEVVDDPAVVKRFIASIFRGVEFETEIAVLKRVIDFGVTVSLDLSIPDFKELIVERFLACMRPDSITALSKRLSLAGIDSELVLTPRSPEAVGPANLRPLGRRQASSRTPQLSPVTSPQLAAQDESPPPDETETAAAVVTGAFVRIFVRSLHRAPEKCAIIYRELLRIMTVDGYDTETYLTACRLLFRIRVDQTAKVLLLHPTDMDGLVSAIQKYRPLADAGSDVRGTWMYPEPEDVLGLALPEQASYSLTIFGDGDVDELNHGETGGALVKEYYVNPARGVAGLNMSTWLNMIIQRIVDGASWELYSYIITHFAPQLSNLALFARSPKEVQRLRAAVCDQISGKLAQLRMPKSVAKADVLVILVRTMSSIIGYHRFFSKQDDDNIVKSVLVGLMSWERTAGACIHCLLVCSYELPISIKKFLSQIFTNFQTKITNSGLSAHILEFLSSMAKVPNLISNFTQDDFKRVFAMAFKYIEYANDQHARQVQGGAADGRATRVQFKYLTALAYSVVLTWFLAMKMPDRRDLSSYIIRGLLLTSARARAARRDEGAPADGGGEALTFRSVPDDRAWACIDLISRFTYSDIPLKVRSAVADSARADSDDVASFCWVHGMSLLTVETAVKTGVSQVVVRRPTGTTAFNVYPDPQLLGTWTSEAALQVHLFGDGRPALAQDRPTGPTVLPGFLYGQLAAGPELEAAVRPVALPQSAMDSQVTRTISIFDRTPVVDFHKIGIVYIGPNQTEERDILANAVGSRAYLQFLDGMGSLVKLRDNRTVYTGGLDTENDHDGEFAYAWSDKISQVVFHCTTLMPGPSRRGGDGGGDDGDQWFANKKRHIGNNYVNIYWNDSGKQFRFDTVRSQFNFMNIVISPHSKTGTYTTDSITSTLLSADGAAPEDGRASAVATFFKVRTYVQDGVPELSPASHLKVIAMDNLPAFVRNLAVNADIFSNVWHSPDDVSGATGALGGGGISAGVGGGWIYRASQIRKICERVEAMPAER